MSERPSFGRNKAFWAAAAALGAGAIIGAAGLFICNFIEEEKRLKEKNLSRESNRENRSQQSTSSKNSICSSRSGDDFFSALDSEYEEDEFFDLNSEDEETLTMALDEEVEAKKKEAKLFEKVDALMKGNDNERLAAFNLLKKYDFQMSENPDFLWRFAKAHQIQAVACEAVGDTTNKKKYIFEGLEYASKALAMDDTNPDVHKWFAILTGMQGDFVPLKQKIQNGCLFQKHVLIAIKSKPEDYSLYHLLGRFKFEVAKVSWFEKKIASSILGEIPDVNYSDAIEDLLNAEKLNPMAWKENRLLLAKCYFSDGKYDKAMHWLNSAKKIMPKTKEDTACDEEISTLMEKYNRYIK